MNNAINILIFKTNVRLKKDLKIIAPFLSACECIIKWNVDRQDTDKILRIESTLNNSAEIVRTINNAGYNCEELQD